MIYSQIVTWTAFAILAMFTYIGIPSCTLPLELAKYVDSQRQYLSQERNLLRAKLQEYMRHHAECSGRRREVDPASVPLTGARREEGPPGEDQRLVLCEHPHQRGPAGVPQVSEGGKPASPPLIYSSSSPIKSCTMSMGSISSIGGIGGLPQHNFPSL